jgi:hypothetical protein
VCVWHHHARATAVCVLGGGLVSCCCYCFAPSKLSFCATGWFLNHTPSTATALDVASRSHAACVGCEGFVFLFDGVTAICLLARGRRMERHLMNGRDNRATFQQVRVCVVCVCVCVCVVCVSCVCVVCKVWCVYMLWCVCGWVGACVCVCISRLAGQGLAWAWFGMCALTMHAEVPPMRLC